MTIIYAYNKQLAVEPPENKGAERKIVNGVAQFEHRSSLTKFKVVFGTNELPAGTTVWVDSRMVANQPWSKTVHEVEGKKVVFLPESIIMLVDGLDE